jgi:prolyl 4-hydroxylase
MSDKPFRWRTTIEVAVISIVLYIFLGAPGLKSTSQADVRVTDDDVPKAQARAESLIYPDVKNLQCTAHDYRVHIFSADPLIIYIDGFLSEHEAKHLVDIR